MEIWRRFTFNNIIKPWICHIRKWWSMIELITADLKTEERKNLIHTSCMWLIAVRKSCWIIFQTKPPNCSTCSGIGGDNKLFVLMIKELWYVQHNSMHVYCRSQWRSQDFGGGANKFARFCSSNNFIALFKPSFWIYSTTDKKIQWALTL